jgi:hypothetical protein
MVYFLTRSILYDGLFHIMRKRCNSAKARARAARFLRGATLSIGSAVTILPDGAISAKCDIFFILLICVII